MCQRDCVGYVCICIEMSKSIEMSINFSEKNCNRADIMQPLWIFVIFNEPPFNRDSVASIAQWKEKFFFSSPFEIDRFFVCCKRIQHWFVCMLFSRHIDTCIINGMSDNQIEKNTIYTKSLDIFSNTSKCSFAAAIGAHIQPPNRLRDKESDWLHLFRWRWSGHMIAKPIISVHDTPFETVWFGSFSCTSIANWFSSNVNWLQQNVINDVK